MEGEDLIIPADLLGHAKLDCDLYILPIEHRETMRGSVSLHAGVAESPQEDITCMHCTAGVATAGITTASRMLHVHLPPSPYYYCWCESSVVKRKILLFYMLLVCFHVQNIWDDSSGERGENIGRDSIIMLGLPYSL